MERRRASSMALPPSRLGAGGRSSIRPPTTRAASSTIRPGTMSRNASSATSRFARAPSPVDSLMSVATSATAGAKRKERDFDPDEGGEATNINVVVRCRGRNEREVKENSAVVVSTEATRGKIVELSMGPNAVSNKTYNFDRVFSQAADQTMVFEDVVKPILDEMLAGYNCTIFAYGQTGTGKTYTMSGDLTETMGMLSDNAGIIPRVLQALFAKLELDEKDHCVRCSFIELYNEELRDLLAADDGTKLKIYDDNSKKGHSTTMVQGMEERHIQSSSDGLKWLREGSLKRQVAATKCNDLSSRSHTVFTITLHVKRNTDNGEDYLMAGKLNLVDLAGSENIQRSGAENKRAAEAGLINKSLLTLGRVINALVDRSAHIPYRESKLTRLLQDSLGGRTKTCIIATVSPAKVNLEETISTLDYAFRAKNIRNKPQLNALINKKTLLRDFTSEIERLKGELIATRQRNGVYLSNDAYEELTVQNESRRILTEEQAAKIETLENNLRNKLQELFALTSSFMGLKKEHEGTQLRLDDTKGVLDQTEIVLAATRKSLSEETHIRKAHQATEKRLTSLASELLGTLDRTVSDVAGLHAKNRRRSDLHNLNRSTWGMSQSHVANITELVENRIQEFRQGQEEHISSISERMQTFVQEELEKLASTQNFLDENLSLFTESKESLLQKKQQSKEEMDNVLEEIKIVRDNVKQRVGESLAAIAGAAEKIAGDVLSELGVFHTQLHASYSSLGKDFKSIFEDLLNNISTQKAESDRLRSELEAATSTIVENNETVSDRIAEVLAEERKAAAAERQALLTQMAKLINSQAEAQENRLTEKATEIQQSLLGANKSFKGKVAGYREGMNSWAAKDRELMESVVRERDVLKGRLKDDWTTANKHSTSIQQTTQSVHAETVRVVDEQLADLDTQMQDLDAFVTRAKSYNSSHANQHLEAVTELGHTVENSFNNIADHCKETFGRVHSLGQQMDVDVLAFHESLDPYLEEELCKPLAELREDIQATEIKEYEPTGETPERVQYQYPRELPKTERHEVLIAGMRDEGTPSKPAPVAAVLPDVSLTPTSPGLVPVPVATKTPSSRPSSSRSDATEMTGTVKGGLREVNPNIVIGNNFDPASSVLSLPPVMAKENEIISSKTVDTLSALPTMKSYQQDRQTGGGGRTRSSRSSGMSRRREEGVENVPPPAAAVRSSGRRKSPRIQ
ncbi:putative kinesin-like protein bimC [Podospora australis]|uniref:Kinesin-like protein bimC n=1 Tax=Podospora australis TaxID=1536484 RepID=A0AAN6WMD0_9PEZI|nr:putative kinesin-like protein bimC [Podospora australis]